MLNKLLVNTAVLSLALLGFSYSPSLAENPPNSTGDNAETTPPTSPSDNGLVNAHRRAKSEACNTNVDKNTPMAFPIGTNSPISFGSIADERQKITDSNLDAIGYMGADGQAKAITMIDICNMLSMSLNNGGMLRSNFNEIAYKHTKIESSNSKTKLAQRRRVPTIDLIVRNRRTKAQYLLPRFNANAFDQDVINSILNKTLKPLNS
ncbi:MAG: hypothetical protein HGA42_17540 [Nostocales cyanobacterium W4_Combined_metabat2_030]|nr:hypothetical protein [Nostocales cyanobacterium W4_Combined_metabat2_030]